MTRQTARILMDPHTNTLHTMAKRFAKKEDVPAAILEDYAEDAETKEWRHKDELAAEAAIAKRDKVLQEKRDEKKRADDAEAEVNRLKHEKVGTDTGLEKTKLDAYAAPIVAERDKVKGERDALQLKLDEQAKENAFIEAAEAAGMMMKRVKDPLNKSGLMAMFKYEKGALVPVDADGNEVGGKTPKDVLAGMAKTHKYLFPYNGGSGGDADQQSNDDPPPQSGNVVDDFIKTSNAARESAPNPLFPTPATAQP